MAINELQWGLLGAGAAVVGGLLAYNKWQDRRLHRRYEESFKSEQPDPLFEGSTRQEPTLDGQSVTDSAESDTSHKPDFRQLDTQALARRAPQASLPGVDSRVDWVVRIESIEGVVSGKLCDAVKKQLADFKPHYQFFAFSDERNKWEVPSVDSTGRCHHFAIALQLVDRRGPVDENDLSDFCHAVNLAIEPFMAIAPFPGRIEALERADALDHFCSSLDIQIAVNVVATGAEFTAQQVADFAAEHQMQWAHGGYHTKNADEVTEFALYGIGLTPIPDRSVENFSCAGLTLVLDVPTSPSTLDAFNKMLDLAHQFAGKTRGVVVDDNRHPFSDKAAERVRDNVANIQAIMQESNIPAGGPLACRLFSS